MPYSPAALQMLEDLGIPLNAVIDRKLQEYVEAKTLERVEVEAQGKEHLLTPMAAQAWRQMKASASTEGVALHIVSAFRSVKRQVTLVKRKLDAGQSIEQILAVSAPPFFSEHHTGCAIDIGTPGCAALEREFEDTQAFEWLTHNAQAFGFQMSYPAGNATGYIYEPWHWKFVAG